LRYVLDFRSDLLQLARDAGLGSKETMRARLEDTLKAFLSLARPGKNGPHEKGRRAR